MGARRHRMFDRYKTYEGQRGSPEQWVNAAQAAMRGETSTISRHLRTLGLAERPGSTADLDAAYRRAVLRAHPDKGGSHEAMLMVQEAYSALLYEMDS